MALADGYRLVDGPPSVDDYLTLRSRSGLSPKTRPQAEAAVDGAWTALHVVAPDGASVGMGRVIHIVDMAVLPEHQRRGLGDAILTTLLDRIRTRAPPDPYITLLADEPGRRLYARHGFVPTAPHSIGMVLREG
jgi:GNAT superfamily N-acetyltransferase